ncbi:helix-turn-helix domain-containing protein, partial [uncultured Alcanivorax sp.]|uniref:helix-turn-helix domain-containing protein n=1 Tax=uncultured Alcanivorax sp. TaxID=191215 RepID=UPI0030DBF259
MRKRPQQQRSRELVKALIDATAKVIQQQGLDNTTTARIAEVAGVRVGPLYQYLGAKDGPIEAPRERLADDIGAGLQPPPRLANV